MNQTKTFNMDLNLLNNYSALFVKLILILIVAYLLVMLFNLIRDKFISPTAEVKKDDITVLFTILYRLFIFGGWGFILGNLAEGFLSLITKGAFNAPQLNIGSWDYLLFGIILIFVGKGLNAGIQQVKKQ